MVLDKRLYLININYMKDQRQFIRKSLHTMVSVFDTDNGKFLGVLVDYSDSGVMISTYQPMKKNASYRFTIVDLPNNIGRKRTGHIEVENVWCDRLNTTLFGSGYKLIESDDAAIAMFRSYDQNIR